MMDMNKVRNYLITTTALTVAGIGGLFAQDKDDISGKNILQNSGFYNELQDQAQVYDLPSDSLKNFANCYIAKLEETGRVNTKDTVTTGDEVKTEYAGQHNNVNGENVFTGAEKVTKNAKRQFITGYHLHGDEGALTNFLEKQGIAIPENNGYVDALQQANKTIMGDVSADEEKQSIVDTTQYNSSVGIMGGLSDNGLYGGLTFSTELCDLNESGDLSLNLKANANILAAYKSSMDSDSIPNEEDTWARALDYDENGTPDIHKRHLEYTIDDIDYTHKNLGSVMLGLEKDFDKGFSASAYTGLGVNTKVPEASATYHVVNEAAYPDSNFEDYEQFSHETTDTDPVNSYNTDVSVGSAFGLEVDWGRFGVQYQLNNAFKEGEAINQIGATYNFNK